MKAYQPRFVAYALAQGSTPAAVADTRFAADYMRWIGAKWTEFAKSFSRSRDQHTEQDHADFDAWLAGAAA